MTLKKLWVTFTLITKENRNKSLAFFPFQYKAAHASSQWMYRT